MIQSRILIRSHDSAQWLPTKLALVAETKKNGKAGNSHLISSRTGHDAGGFEIFERPNAISN